jgi:hypothetical protein
MAARAPGLRRVTAEIGTDGAWIALACELLFAAALVVTAADLALRAPLCGACRRWCRRQAGVVSCAAHEPIDRVTQRAVARDWLFFRGLGPPAGRTALRIDLAICPSRGCDRSSAVSVWLVRPLLPASPVVIDLRIGADDLRTIVAMRQRTRTRRPSLRRPATTS